MPMVLLVLFFLLLGLCVGSFLNVVILSSVKNESFWERWRSRCPKCKHPLSVLDLVPILSFFFLKGRCRYCGKKISWQYPLVELSTALIFTALGLKFLSLDLPVLADAILTLVVFVIAAILIVSFVIDLRWGLVPTTFVWVGVAFAIVLKIIELFVPLGQIWASLHSTPFGFYPLQTDYFKNQLVLQSTKLGLDVAAGATVGFIFWLLVKVTRGRGMGQGDISLGVLAGVLTGWASFTATLLLSFILGSLVALVLVALKKKNLKSTVPFGPFIIIATFAVLIFGSLVEKVYQNLFGI